MANQSLMAQFLPSRFIPIEAALPGRTGWRDSKTGMHIIETKERHGTPRWVREWYHVSMSYPDRLPTYDEMQMVRKCFIGEAHTALQIFPPKSEYVNVHQFCLHLYVCLDEEVVPDSIIDIVRKS